MSRILEDGGVIAAAEGSGRRRHCISVACGVVCDLSTEMRVGRSTLLVGLTPAILQGWRGCACAVEGVE